MCVTYSLVLVLHVFYHLLHFAFVVTQLPLEDALVDVASTHEEVPIRTNQTLRHLIQVLRVVVVVRVALHIRIIEEAHSADLIAHDDDRFSEDFADLRNIIIRRELVSHALQFAIRAQSFSQPFQLEVDCFALDGPVCFDFVEGYFADVVFAEEVEVVGREVQILDGALEPEYLLQLDKPIISLIQGDLRRRS